MKNTVMPADRKFQKTLLCALLGFMAAAPAARAAPLDFSQTPPGQVDFTPAPNVILSFDNSSRMSNDTVGGGAASPSNPTKMDMLKSSLQDIFSDTSFLPDGKIRLGWQAMWQVGVWAVNPDVHLAVGSQVDNLRVLDAEQRANFLSFLNDSLEVPHCKVPPPPATMASCNIPAHRMFRQVYTYMNNQSRDSSSPWAGTPGVSAEPWLSCRRAYHIYLTSGRWNRNTDSDCPKPYDPANPCINEFFPLGGNGEKAPTYSYDGSYPTRTLPDGTVYNPTKSNVKIYIDAASKDAVPLADWAFISWATNLSGLGTGVVPTDEYKNAPPTETVTGYSGAMSAPAVVEKYWNPKYDPATWQHLSTYVIGYGQEPTEWKKNLITDNPPTKGYPTSMLPFGWDGAYPWFWINVTWPLAEGYFWPGGIPYDQDPGPPPESDASLDLWHTAINGRGRFYAVKKNEDLKLAFKEILQTINDESSNGVAGISASSSANVYDSVGLFTAGYDSTKAWAGYVYANRYNVDGTIEADPNWGNGGTGYGGQQTTADKLDALADGNSRVILTTRDDAARHPVAFRWATDEAYLSTAQKNLLQSEQVLNFLRGDRTQETGATPPGELRPRQSRQGDIVNSGIWYVGMPAGGYSRPGYQDFRKNNSNRTPMLYVGGNDGMLHGFSAADGSEKLGYVPMGLMDKLARLADPGYSHAYYVDNTPFSGDVNLSEGGAAANWQTLLVGTLGAGGRGYFVLNITNPGAFSESNAAGVVVLDKTFSGSQTPAPGSADNDIGYIFAPPTLDDANPFLSTQITRMNDGRWAAVLGNGYNSVNQRPVLLIQYLDGGRELKTIVATAPDSASSYYSGNPLPNGLSAPRVVDLNGDGTADVAYAGDLRGDLWKFDLTSADPGQWQVAFGGSPLYTAISGTGKAAVAQPIFAPPAVKANDRGAGGMMVAFGTGANLTLTDRVNTNTQTIYSMLDNTRYEPDPASPGKLKIITAARGTPGHAGYIPAPAVIGTGVSLLQQQSIGAESAGVEAKPYWNVDATPIDWNTQKGWYLNLPATGERLLKPMPFYDGSNILAVFTQIPASGSKLGVEESCSGGATTPPQQYATLLNIMDGQPPSISLMDRNGDGIYDAADGLVARTTLAAGATSMVSSRSYTRVFSGGVKSGTGTQTEKWRNMPETPVRPSWRQMQARPKS